MANTVDLNNITEYDDTRTAEGAVKELAALLQNAKHAIVFTGAGISTSASIPDFRGPQGVWTRQAQGRSAPKCIPLQQAIPTVCHDMLARYVREGVIKYIVSQNIDGLHRRSGVPRDLISELHGNTFLEVCWSCDHQIEHTSEVDGGLNGRGSCASCLTRVPHFCHCTGRKCPSCGAESMRDSIIHFGENLPRVALREAYRNADAADLCIVLGSSLTVSPANDIPKRVAQRDGKLVIVNLQKTDLDDLATLRIFAKTDPVSTMLDAAMKPHCPPRQEASITVGNRHVLLPDNGDGNRHQWTVFVQPALGAHVGIERVEFKLHPTFEPSLVTVQRPAETGSWSCTRVGWGTFVVGISVHLKGRSAPVELTHQLQFDQESVSRTVSSCDEPPSRPPRPHLVI